MREREELSARVTARIDDLFDRAHPLSESLDDFLREEDEGVRLLSLSYLLQFLAGHRSCSPDVPCPMASRKLDYAVEAVIRVFNRLGLSVDEAQFCVAAVVGNLALNRSGILDEEEL